MPFHGFISWEDVDNATIAGLVGPASDQKMKRDGDKIFLPSNLTKVIAVKALGANITRARWETPSNRDGGGEEILPIDDAVQPTTNFPMNWELENPRNIVGGEAIEHFTVNSGGAAIEQSIAMLLTPDEGISPIVGEQIMHVDFTATVASTAREWVDADIVLGESLKQGDYAVVGAHVIEATGLFARFIFPTDELRPMVPVFSDEAEIQEKIFRNGGLGEFGTFQDDNTPRIEVFKDSTGTAVTGVLDIVQR